MCRQIDRRRALLGLLLCIMLVGLSSLETRAQKRQGEERIPLREYTTDRAFSRLEKAKAYFFDEKGDLDKFVGLWEGASWNGYSIKADLILIRKNPFLDLYDMDQLALALQVEKDGKAVPTSLVLDDLHHRAMGLHLSSRARFAKADDVVRRYILVLAYGDDPDAKYNGSRLTEWEINAAQDEILVFPGGGVTVEGEYRIPEYARGKKISIPIWRLHRVK